jgi:hypothetical protein
MGAQGAFFKPMSQTILAASWHNGLFVITGDAVRHELADQPVRALYADRSGVLAIVGANQAGGNQLCRRSPDGHWDTLASSDSPLSCLVAIGDTVLVGTDDAQVLRLGAAGTLQPLPGFALTEGRNRWYAGTAVIDGRVIGPPLGVRSIAATCNGTVLLANVHVGGIPRSTDQGASWQPTVDIDWDVHQVCTHPARPEVVVAAAAAGVCISVDHGATWTASAEGLHAPYCAAAAFDGDDVLVCAAKDHFATSAGLYRLPVADPAAIQPVEIGESRWLGAIIDTHCLVSKNEWVVAVDRTGHLNWSEDGGRDWHSHAQRFPMTSAVLLYP